MRINSETFEYASGLARLSFNENDARRQIEFLQDIGGLIESLKELDGVLPDEAIERSGTMLRADVPDLSLDREALMVNSSDNDGALFIVPQMI